MVIVRLESSDKKIIEVDETIANFSDTIKDILEGCGMGADKDVIPLHTINSTILAKIFEWVDRHKSDEKIELETHEVEKAVTSEDKKFFGELDQLHLYELMLAANYLAIKKLFRMLGYTIAQQVKGKTIEELRIFFNLPNDITTSTELVPVQ